MSGELTTAIGLGARLKPIDTRSNSNMLMKQIAKDKDNKKKVSEDVNKIIDDMVVTDGNMLPAWSERMKTINSDVVNKAMEYINDGKPNPQVRLWQYYTNNVAPQQQLLTQGNKKAMEYLNNNGKHLVYDDVTNLLSTEKDMAKVQQIIADKKDNSLMGSEDGGFSFIPIQNYDYKEFLKVDKSSDYVPSAKPIDYIHNGLITTTTDYKLNPDVESAKRDLLLNDPHYMIVKAHAAPVDVRTDPQKLNEFLLNAVDEDMKKLSYSKTKQSTYNAPKTGVKPRKGSDDSDDYGNPNQRFIVEEADPNVDLFMSTKNKYGNYIRFSPQKRWVIKDNSTTGENKRLSISSTNALNMKTGKWGELNGSVRILEAWRGYNMKDTNGKVVSGGKKDYVVVQTEQRGGKNKPNILTNYLVPKEVIGTKLKAYTSDKKADNGWEFPDDGSSNKNEPTDAPKADNKKSKYKNIDLLNDLQ